MRSKSTASWLARVERILTAKTPDLRQLARLAELDPATMYMGTRLDGADLRGQDLRGMALTHLDPKTVQMDERTLLDGQPDPKISIFPKGGLVMLHDRQLEEGYRRQTSRMPYDIKIFGPAEADAFWQACEVYDGPKLILALGGGGVPLRPYRPNGADPTGVIHVLGVSARTAQYLVAIDQVRDELTAPTVFVPLPLDYGARRGTALSAAFCDFVALAAAEWGFVGDLAHNHGISLFFSASPEANDDPQGAWFQLSSRLWKLGLSGGAGFRIGAQSDGRGGELSSLLFPDLKARSVREYGRWPGARAMVLFSPTGKRWGPSDDAYADIVTSILEANGWAEVGVHGQRVSDIPPIALAGFHFEGEHFALHLDISFRSVAKPHPIRANALPISAAEGLCVSEDTDAAAILLMLNEHHRLLVNLQDLRWLDAAAPSLWPLVAHQARRIARGSHSRPRTLYFVALMRNAIELNRGRHGVTALVERLDTQDFGRSERLRIVTVEFERGRVVFQVSISASGLRDPGLTSFLLGVDASGPFIEGLSS